MSVTTRTIVADCTSGDGSQLIISTEVRDEEVALSFTIKPGAEGMDSCVRLGSDALEELITFQNLESARYAAEWETTAEDEDEDEGVPS